MSIIKFFFYLVGIISVVSFSPLKVSGVVKINKNTNLFASIRNVNNVDLTKQLKYSLAAVALGFLSTVCNPALVMADEDKAAQKLFEACYSQCKNLLLKFLFQSFIFIHNKGMFEETRPPPVGAPVDRILETKPRSQLLRECRTRCAKNKKQLMIGKPKEVSTPQKLASQEN